MRVLNPPTLKVNTVKYLYTIYLTLGFGLLGIRHCQETRWSYNRLLVFVTNSLKKIFKLAQVERAYILVQISLSLHYH